MGRKTIALQDLAEHINLEELEKKQSSETNIDRIIPTNFEETYSVLLSGTDAMTLKEISNILKTKLKVKLSCQEVCSRILNSFFNGESYVTMFNLTKRVRISMTEIMQLKSLTKEENEILVSMISLPKKNVKIRSLLRNIEEEMQILSGKVLDVFGSSASIEQLYESCSEEYDRQFGERLIRKGYKRLILRASIVAMCYGNNK